MGLIILTVAMILAGGLVYLTQYLSQRQLSALLDAQREQIRELLNRIQSDDLHAFATMQHNTSSVSPDDIQYLRSDEAEAKQLMEMYGNVQGVGDVIYSQEEINLATDLGLTLDD